MEFYLYFFFIILYDYIVNAILKFKYVFIIVVKVEESNLFNLKLTLRINYYIKDF